MHHRSPKAKVIIILTSGQGSRCSLTDEAGHQCFRLEGHWREAGRQCTTEGKGDKWGSAC